MDTEIYDDNSGRGFDSYELLDEIVDTYGLSRRAAHEGIHAFLGQIIGIDGYDNVVLSSRPARPELLEYNPSDLDVRYWLRLSDGAIETIRDAFAASQEHEDGDGDHDEDEQGRQIDY